MRLGSFVAETSGTLLMASDSSVFFVSITEEVLGGFTREDSHILHLRVLSMLRKVHASHTQGLSTSKIGSGFDFQSVSVCLPSVIVGVSLSPHNFSLHSFRAAINITPILAADRLDLSL
jgi:hypothetical protein